MNAPLFIFVLPLEGVRGLPELPLEPRVRARDAPPTAHQPQRAVVAQPLSHDQVKDDAAGAPADAGVAMDKD